MNCMTCVFPFVRDLEGKLIVTWKISKCIFESDILDFTQNQQEIYLYIYIFFILFYSSLLFDFSSFFSIFLFLFFFLFRCYRSTFSSSFHYSLFCVIVICNLLIFIIFYIGNKIIIINIRLIFDYVRTMIINILYIIYK